MAKVLLDNSEVENEAGDWVTWKKKKKVRKKLTRNVLFLKKKKNLKRVLLKSAKLQIISHRFCNKANLCKARFVVLIVQYKTSFMKVRVENLEWTPHRYSSYIGGAR